MEYGRPAHLEAQALAAPCWHQHQAVVPLQHCSLSLPEVGHTLQGAALACPWGQTQGLPCRAHLHRPA